MQPDRMSIAEDLLTYPEAAAYLNITMQSLRSAIGASEKLHPVKIAGIGHKFLHRSDLDNYRSRGRQSEADKQAAEQAVSQDTLRDIVGQILASQRQTAVDVLIGSAVGNKSLLETMLGREGASDPK